ncbi:MAG: TatD family hydrolase [Anaerolineae bacterium]
MNRPIRLVDTHCHLGWRAFDADRDDVIRRAIDAGVTRMVTIGIDVASSRDAVTLAEQHAAVYAAVGVHPNDAAGFNEQVLDGIRALAQHPKVVAIGEIGLDNYWKKVSPEAQTQAFTTQLELAIELNKPVIIHNRDTTDAILSILERYVIRDTQYAGVLHSFSESVAVAQRAFELGFLIGISGPITFKKSQHLRELVRAVPPDRFVIETDAPFLAPEPRRGRRNEPAYVKHIADQIARERRVSIEDIAGQTTVNAARLFGWANDHAAPSP